MRSSNLSIVLVIVWATILVHNVLSVFTDCGGWLEGDRGVIQTPNFPARFPTPINCAWVIHNPHPQKKIILYFTQYFLKNSFHLSEYDEYKSEHENWGIKYLGEMNHENEFSSMAAYKPYLVIRFKVHDIGNMHLRVEEFLKDVYGFNITYEVVKQEQNVREACSAHDCSYLGHCLANSKYNDYHCDCFSNFFGNYCQYGPFCDPDRGKNMCENDGKCRYFMGSLVNVCDCTSEYTGEQCQERKHRDLIDNDCRLGCSHDCERSEDGEYTCICGDGFRLDVDNITCIEKEMYRISVSFPLKGVSFIKSNILDEIVSHRLQPFRLIKKMRIVGLTTATRLKYNKIRENHGSKVLMFHFYVEMLELPLINTTILELITHGRFLNISVDTKNIDNIIDPEMKLLYVENYDQGPAVEGKLLTIACIVRGSAEMTFKWYKDGALFDTSLTDRNAWVVRIPRTMKDKQMSILNIDGVTVYDKGTFVCSIGDFGETQNKSLVIEVITYPHMEVTPLAVSLEKGQQVGFRCVTPDDTTQTFHYQWFKNGIEISSDNGDEIIEDLLPSGSRLLVRRVTSDANYTCYITNTAGMSNLTAHVFVLPGNQTNQICPAVKYKGVKWKKMGAGNFDVERCPTDTGDVNVLRNIDKVGYSTRTCECRTGTYQWSKPNFAKCQSGHLVEIYDRLETLRLGYQHDYTSDIFDTLFNFIKKASTKMLAGDVDVSCYILHTFIKTLWLFPIHAPNTGLFTYQSLMEMIDLLLQQAINSNHQEQQDLYVAPKLIDITVMLSKIKVPCLQLKYGDSILRSTIGFRVKILSVIPEHMESDGNINYNKPVKSKAKRAHDGAETNTIAVAMNKNSTSNEIKKKVKTTVEFYFKKISSLMKVDAATNSALVPVSDVVSINLLNDWDSLEERVEIYLKHTLEEQSLILQNETKCLRWNNYKMSFWGYWDESMCRTIHHNITTTTCWCTIPGSFAVFIKPDYIVKEANYNTDTVVLVGCILSLCGISATLFVYLFTWRYLIGNIHCIHINLVISVAVVNILCLLCLTRANIENVCVAVKILIQFFYLAAFSFMFVESVHMFVLINGGNRIRKTCLKYFLIGWGIPTISTGCVVIASETLGYDKNCSDWCWLSQDHWHYYSFLIPVVILILALIGLTSAGLVSVYKWTEEWRYHDRKKYIHQGAQIIIIQVLLSICCLTGSKILQQDGQIYSYIFIISDMILCGVIFMFFCVLNSQILSSGVFRSFMLPEKVDETNETLEQNIQEHHNAVNNRKYTAERKRQLRFLVGSSDHHSNSSITASGSGLGSDGQMRYKRNSNRENIDSGFSEEPGNDRSPFKNNCFAEIHATPVHKDAIVSKSIDKSSKESYVLADFPSKPIEKVNDNSFRDNEKMSTVIKNTRFIFTTDGSSDPLLRNGTSSIR